jgi:hypothetical protein
MAIDQTKFEMTPMTLLYGPLGTEVDMGGTLGHVAITFKYDKAALMADQSGKEVLDRRVTGLEIKVTTELAEVKDMNKWKILFPNASIVGTGTAKAIVFSSKVGDSDLDYAQSLVLHPKHLPLTDKSLDFNFGRAVATSDSSISYGHAEQSKLKIDFTIYRDAAGNHLRFGDPAIV